MQKRRLGLLLALLPATLAPATAALLWEAPSSDGNSFWLTPMRRETPEAPRGPASDDHAATAVEGDAGTAAPERGTQPREPHQPNVEAAPDEVEPGEVIGLPLFANATVHTLPA